MPSTRSQSREREHTEDAAADRANIEVKIDTDQAIQQQTMPPPADFKPAKAKSTSSKSSSTSLKRIKLLQAEKKVIEEITAAKLRAAEERAKLINEKTKLVEDSLMQRLQIEKQLIEEEDDDGTGSQSSFSVAKWVDTTVVQTATPAKTHTLPPQPPDPEHPLKKPTNIKSVIPDVPASSNDVKLLAAALHKSHRAIQSLKLPTFDGKASEWLIYKAAYDEDAAELSMIENLRRLRATIKGEARSTVSSLLITNTDPKEVMAALELRFGNQHCIINEQLEILKNLPHITKSEVQSLAKFTSTVNNCVTTIKTLNRIEHLQNPELYSTIIKKLDSNTKDRFYDYAETVHSDSSPILLCLTAFLKREAERCLRFAPFVTTSIPSGHPGTPPSQPALAPSAAPYQRYSVNATSAEKGMKNYKCLLCNGDHVLPKCELFTQKSVDDRWQFIKDNKLCVRCVLYKHPGKFCKISKYLHRLLRKENTHEEHSFNRDPPHQLNNCCNKSMTNSKTYLKVLPVIVSGPLKSVKTFALLDEGATITLINSDLAQEIGADGPSDPLHLKGLGLNIVENSKRVNVSISGKHSKIFNINARTKNSLELGLQCVNKPELMQFEQIQKVEQFIDWYSHGVPKIIIGQDNWPLIITQEICAGESTQPVASKTSLGWVLHGCISNVRNVYKLNHKHVVYKVSDSIDELYKVENFENSIYRVVNSENDKYKVVNSENDKYMVVDSENDKYRVFNSEDEKYRVSHSDISDLPCDASNRDDDLYTIIKQSFELDSLGIQPKVRCNPIEERAIEILQSTTKRLDGTTWETGLLWQSENVILPNLSINTAVKRFEILERKLKKNPGLCTKYTEQMQKLFQNHYAVVCSQQCNEIEEKNKSWFLPHFAVINPNKPGKVRPVFDAAAKTQGVSLNDKLLTGPDLLQSLLGLLWRFRLKRIGASADIRDMFLKIKIKEEDQNYQKFLWREPTDSAPPKICKMTSMLFGATCSPCSAIYVKDTNARQFQDKYPDSVEAIIRNHYVDDYLDSYDHESEAIQRAAEIIYIHSQGGFDIRSWASNSEAVLKTIPEANRAHESIDLTPEAGQQNKTLGMVWEPATDTLNFNLSMHRVPSKIATCQEYPTKRQMLSVIMSVFDPLGLVTPLTIKGRILLQEVWRTKVGWDDKIEEKQFEKWQKWIHELGLVKECKIPRCYSPRLNPWHIDLHTFCDASEKAYAAACYFRYHYEDGEVKVVLVAAKAKVTPLKPMSIPRLELQAALLGARLARTVVEEHKVKLHDKFFWSDSGTTLAWIRSDPRKYKAYVGHRLAAIDDLSSPSQWKWVPTADNVADMATRDIAACNFTPDDRWFTGPSFLYQPEKSWPTEKVISTSAPETTTEEKAYTIVNKTEFSTPEFTRFSSLQRLIRTTAYILLFINRCRKTGECHLSVELLNKAEKILIKKSQFDSYFKEISHIKNNTPCKESSLLQVCPYLDSEDILRARGRIDSAPEAPEACKRPIILDHSNDYTKLLISDYHKKQNHASTETVLNEIKQKYYISKLRSTLRLVTHHCQFCKIKRATPSPPIMGDLPRCRLDHHKRPFTHCGLDYFGPIEVTIGRRREKRYGALFTCMVTRAVHVELAASLTSDSAIMAIRRMISRRGCPTDIYSDNGTNFKGAETELKKAWNELMKDDNFQQELLKYRINWHFIPATAAHMGGAWERLVQSIKKALYATLHERAPREETLVTLLVEAEHTVNSRPLTHVSDDVNDPEALTPNHFLLGTSSGVPLPGKFDDKDLMLRKQWKIAQRLADMFWKRWLKEYLPTLLPRSGKDCDEDLKVGDLVVIADGALPRNMWPKGIIKATFPGKDNRVRVVEVKATGGTFRRPSNKIMRLPVEVRSQS